ncbi:antirepressor protein [Streptococcus phage Javan173]|uniref:phage antirepressor Ant n=1 Tax=Streptococcus entericus TaxID=155680 RepID=UPI000373E139|nr:phage antirepressor Ant [Streptococcus entericus]QBX15177.1 antirepressor protein [Streptococcus phage Javan173]
MELQIFKNDQFGQIRTADINGEVYFNLKDCCHILDIKNHKDVVSRLNPKGVATTDLLTNGGTQQANFINEANFYKLVFQSRKPEAEKFADWVTAEVLPTIRKQGAYVTDYKAVELVSNPKALGDFLQSLTDQVKSLEAKLEKQKPQVLFANAVSASQTSILIGDFAKLLRQNGKNIGQNRLFAWLREHGFLINRKGNSWNMPTQRSMDMGLFEIKETTINHSDGHITISKTPKMTGKGQVYFMEKLLVEEVA